MNNDEQREALFARLQKLRTVFDDIYMRIDGLGMCPKLVREAKFQGLQAELEARNEEADAIRKELQALSNPQP